MRASPVLALALVLAACGGARGRSIEQVPRLANLGEIMNYQSAVIDPQFSRIGGPVYTDADLAAFADASAKIQAASLRIKEFSMGTDFDLLAARLHDRARDLGVAAAAKDVNGASQALEAMRTVCKDCHRAYR